MSKARKIVVENSFLDPVILCIEPWATEYGMMPGEQFEIVPANEKDTFYFHLVFEPLRITVFVEGPGSSHPQILLKGKLLDYGHNSF